MASPSGSLSRRALLRSAAGAATMPLGLLGTRAWAAPPPAASLKPVKFAWNSGGACLSPVALAVKEGLFKKHGIDVELINYSGSTDQLLESLATGKADAAVGMALRWIKPLEQGFDVKLVGGTHGGCQRLLGDRNAGITTDLHSLKGKIIGTTDLGGPDKNFFSIMMQKQGIDPFKDVEWRQYPGDLLPLAVEKGEIQAISFYDPLTWVFLKRYPNLFEVATNLSGEYANRLCCLIGVRGSLIRQDRPLAGQIMQALHEAQDLTYADPRLAAEAYLPYSAKTSVEDLVSILKSHTHGHHPGGIAFRQELVLYAEELRGVNVLKANTDPQKFADRIYADVLS